LEKLPDFSEIEKRVFEVRKDGFYIGGVKITPEIRDLLKEQSKYLETSQLWEILNASIANEAINLSLIQSQNFEHVQFAKALWHWSAFMQKVVNKLSTVDASH
jgi:hypothetical protein